MKYVLTFTVVGCGDFPFDMLRYDCCFPDTESDSCSLLPADEPTGRLVLRKVVLRRYQMVKTLVPTTARWESFGWKVIGMEYKQLY